MVKGEGMVKWGWRGDTPSTLTRPSQPKLIPNHWEKENPNRKEREKKGIEGEIRKSKECWEIQRER
jgi:hypothetical protein